MLTVFNGLFNLNGTNHLQNISDNNWGSVEIFLQNNLERFEIKPFKSKA